MFKRAIHTAAIVFVLCLSSRNSFAQDAGADTFKAKCLMCHGADGLGNTPMGKALAIQSYKAPEVLKLKDPEITAIIKNGKNGKMPAFNGQVTDAEIKDLVKYIHTLQK